MKKLLAGILASIAAVGIAWGVGQAPTPGFRMMDGAYVLGLAQGQNNTFTNGIAAAGTTQATATAIPASLQFVEIDTTAASTGISIPFALPGASIRFYNNGASTLTIYPNVTNNPVSAAQDTINNGTSASLATHTAYDCFSAKAGVWACQ